MFDSPFEELRRADLMLAFSMLHQPVPYLWGGQTREGCDCSGFNVFRHRLLGVIGKNEDLNAQMYYDRFSEHGLIMVPKAGALYVYGSSLQEINHIALIISPQPIRTIDAPGGSSKITTPSTTVMFGIHPHKRRGREDILAIIDPFLHLQNTQE